jgi:hypothetical protein
MAEQIAAASQAISLIPPLPDAVYADLSKRMDDIEQAQKHIESEFALLKDAISKITEGPENFQKALDEHIATSKLESVHPRSHHLNILTIYTYFAYHITNYHERPCTGNCAFPRVSTTPS